MNNFILNEEFAKKVLDIVDQGLTRGVGRAAPGHMCVEAAVMYALGLNHSDEPPCVADTVRSLKILLNDKYGWKNTKNRAAGMRRLAIAQLGTADLPNFGPSRRFPSIPSIPFNKKTKTLRDDLLKPMGLTKLQIVAEQIVQILIELEAPGAAFLYLAPVA